MNNFYLFLKYLNQPISKSFIGSFSQFKIKHLEVCLGKPDAAGFDKYKEAAD